MSDDTRPASHDASQFVQTCESDKENIKAILNGFTVARRDKPEVALYQRFPIFDVGQMQLLRHSAQAESFYSRLKAELLENGVFESVARVRRVLCSRVFQ